MAKVLLVAHWDWVLWNFRLPLARALKDRGHEVILVFPFGEYAERLRATGFRCVHWSVKRESLNPLREIAAIVHLAHIYRREKPDLVTHFTVKPNLYGSIAAAFCRNLKVINTFTGLGFLFSDHPKAKGLRPFVLPVLRLAARVKDSWTVVQNNQDAEILVRMKVAALNRLQVIVSSGVDTQQFSPNGEVRADGNSLTPVVLMAARLLWDKGVKEFVEAARLLREKGVVAEFWLVGKPDDGNPMCVSEDWLRERQTEGLIKWLGHRDDMPQLLHQADIAVLPSYHEGVPRFLLEAAACGLPLVATDIEGCRTIVRHGENGFLVPIRDPKALADAIEQLVVDRKLRARMGQASREIAVREFDQRKILEEWLRLYERVLTS